MRFSRWAVLALLATASLSACSDIGTAPQQINRPAVAARSADVSSANGPSLTPKSVKYRDTGSKPSRGRSGTAVVASRALLGMDGTTVIETTTGEFDTDVLPAGTLTKTQTKVFAANGALLSTRNTNGLSSATTSLTLAGVASGNTIQVQAHVRGVDGRRTDVVTVLDTARLRPDVRAKIVAPARGLPNTPTVILGVLNETNGQVGAFTDCNLYVNDQLVGQSTHIWIDGGGAVSCRFVHAFSGSGTQRVRVTAENVQPGDWNMANNSAMATVVITVPTTTFTANAEASYSIQEYRSATRQTYTLNGFPNRYTDEFTQQAAFQTINFAGSTAHGMDFGGGIVLRMQTGGTLYDARVIDTTVLRQAGPILGTPANGSRCYSNISPLFELRVCSSWTGSVDSDGRRGGTTSFQYIHSASDIVYTSKGSRVDQWSLPDGYYYENVSRSQRGTILGLGSSVDVAITLLGQGGETMRAALAIPLTTSLDPENSDTEQCTSENFGNSESLETCTLSRYFQSITSGSAYLIGN